MRDPLKAMLAAWALGVLSVGVSAASTAAAATPEQRAGAAQTPASAEVVKLADWIFASGDNKGLPFMIIDKTSAEVFVFGGDGLLRGVAPALLGFARGDDSAPGIGEKELSKITPEERTTPAGRFVAGFGASPSDKDILWVDYETAVSIHQVVNNNPKEQRLKRLESPSVEDNRITFGCINVPPDFYNKVVVPEFTGTSGVAYVLPETRPIEEVFLNFQHQERPLSGLAAASATGVDAGATAAADDVRGRPDAH
jgi:hypothetical protein